jgi:predicted nucleotidyltransferase
MQQALHPIFESFDAIEAIYLFGSTASGTARTDSDVDIAVRCVYGTPSERCFDLRRSNLRCLTPM